MSAFSPLPPEDLEQVSSAPWVPWEALRNARIFLTGGTGFFGTWLVQTFVHANARYDLNAELVVLSRDPARFLAQHPHLSGAPGLAFTAGDVRTFAFPSGRFTHVVHAATSSDARDYAADPRLMLDTIVQGTRRALDFATGSGAKRLLFVSSGAVYGPQPSELTHVPETFLGSPDPLDRASTYAQGKRVAEHLCALTPSVECVIARAFAFVGPLLPLDQHFAIGNFLRDALAGRPVQVGGDGTPYRSYLHARDLSSWLWALLLRGASARAYNVGSARDLSIRDVATLVSREVGTGEVTVARSPVPGARAMRYVPSVERITAELGVRETLSLEEAVASTAAWHRRQRENAR